MKSKLIESPTRIQAAGNPPKQIEEFIGRVNTGTNEVSVARMLSPAGWKEPGQTPRFNEYSIVLRGSLHVRFEGEEIEVKAGQAIMVKAGDWVQYGTPEGAEYIAVCVPAFTPETVNRDLA